MKMNTWTRKERVANPADPTAVTTWKFHVRFIRIELIASWGVEAQVFIPGPSWLRLGRWRRSYDAWWAKQLYGWLESGYWEAQMATEPDPMGNLSDYE